LVALTTICTADPVPNRTLVLIASGMRDDQEAFDRAAAAITSPASMMFRRNSGRSSFGTSRNCRENAMISDPSMVSIRCTRRRRR
jgi:hypothetical protein